MQALYKDQILYGQTDVDQVAARAAALRLTNAAIRAGRVADLPAAIHAATGLRTHQPKRAT